MRIDVGDTVFWKSTDPGHNIEFIKGGVPAGVEKFKTNMDQMLIKLKETKPSPGNNRVIYPGLLEREEEIFRIKNGIPIHKNLVEWLDSLSKQYGIEKIHRRIV